MRKLASIQTIGNIQSIPQADRVEVATVLGWSVVVGKGEFAIGEKVIYLEIDSLLPDTLPVFEDFQKRGKGKTFVDGVEVTGHVLKTIKLRGVYSQGLILKLDQFGDDIYHWAVEEGEAASTDPSWEPWVGMDVSEAIGVVKWEEALPLGSAIVGGWDSRFAPKTDAVRVQGISELWPVLRSVELEASVKVDGSSHTLVNDGGSFRIFSRNWEIKDEAAGMQVAQKFGILKETVPGMAVQFELVGPGIQANRLKLPEQRPFVFAVWIDGKKLSRSQWPDTFLKFSAPQLDISVWGLEETMVETIEKISKLKGNVTPGCRDEGVVYHVNVADLPLPLFGKLDRNLNFKIINPSYLISHNI